jgi:hypothetical protein
MNNNRPLTPWWEVPLRAVGSLCAGLLMAALLERALIPDPCHYHTAEYLGGKDLPWWIKTFFPLDAMGHPEPTSLFYGAFGSLGAVAVFFFLARRAKNAL